MIQNPGFPAPGRRFANDFRFLRITRTDFPVTLLAQNAPAMMRSYLTSVWLSARGLHVICKAVVDIWRTKNN